MMLLSAIIRNPGGRTPVRRVVTNRQATIRGNISFLPGASRRGICLRVLLGCVALLFGAANLPGQMIPDAPIENFRLPMFGDDGYRAWDLRGDQAIYVNADQIDVLGMLLRVYTGGAQERVRILIESTEAHVYITKNEAHGDKNITVSGDNYTATGEEWSWLPDEDRIVIRQNVQVVFREELEGFLMPLP